MQELYWVLLPIAIIVIFGIVMMVAMKRRRPKISARDERFLQDMWRKVLHTKQSNPGKAIIDADKIVDKAMSMIGYQGTFGEKLKKHSSVFSDLSGIWRAHKLRNKIAHELDFHPSDRDVSDALTQFKRALADLGLKV